DEGVHYRSHVDGRVGLLRPEDAVAAQEALGVDIAMSLDECVPSGTPRERVARAVDRTGTWAARGLAARTRSETALFGIVQGGFDVALCAASAAGLTALDFDGYGVGGLSVGERPADTAWAAPATVARLPHADPLALMGGGTP